MKRLSNLKRIVIIGCGGTGSWLSTMVCRMLANDRNFTGEIWFVDGDKYEADNAGRQEFVSVMTGFNKAEAQCRVMGKKFPLLEDKVQYFDEYLGTANIADVVVDNSVVFNCVDNHAARYLVDQHVQTLRNCVHVCGGNEHHDGQVQMHMRYEGRSVTRPIDVEFPEIRNANGDRSEMSCEELAALPSGGQIIAANVSAASMMLNFFVSSMTQDHFMSDCVRFDVHTLGYKCIGSLVSVRS